MVRLHLLVERDGGESTRGLQIFRVAYHPGNAFWLGWLPGLHHIVERLHRNSTSRQRNISYRSCASGRGWPTLSQQKSAGLPRPSRAFCERAGNLISYLSFPSAYDGLPMPWGLKRFQEARCLRVSGLVATGVRHVWVRRRLATSSNELRESGSGTLPDMW